MNRLARSLFVVLLLGAPAVARAEETAEMSEARKQFQAGVNLLDDPDGAKYEEAYHAFKNAYELSRSPKVLGNIAATVISPSGAASRTSFQVRERIRNLRERRIL